MVFGAVLRHVPVVAQPGTFMLAVKLHLALALILTLHVVALLWSIARHARNVAPLGRLGIVLGVVVLLQLLLGAGTWIVKYFVPSWAPAWLAAMDRSAIVEGGWLQTHVVTAHVAVGSLLLATTVALALQAGRKLAPAPAVSNDLPLSRREAIV
jgi:hypothetical protein